jgi:hypothetical protein
MIYFMDTDYFEKLHRKQKFQNSKCSSCKRKKKINDLLLVATRPLKPFESINMIEEQHTKAVCKSCSNKVKQEHYNTLGFDSLVSIEKIEHECSDCGDLVKFSYVMHNTNNTHKSICAKCLPEIDRESKKDELIAIGKILKEYNAIQSIIEKLSGSYHVQNWKSKLDHYTYTEKGLFIEILPSKYGKHRLRITENGFNYVFKKNTNFQNTRDVFGKRDQLLELALLYINRRQHNQSGNIVGMNFYQQHIDTFLYEIHHQHVQTIKNKTLIA